MEEKIIFMMIHSDLKVHSSSNRIVCKTSSYKSSIHWLTDSIYLFIFTCESVSDNFLVAQKVKNLPAMQETRVLNPWSGSSPGEGNGNPHAYSCLENSMDGGAWWATVHGVTKSQT